MKNAYIYLLLATFITSACCQAYLSGYNEVTIQANEDPQSCLLKLTYATTATNEITFYESVYNPLGSCTYQNLTFQSQFNNYPASGSINLYQDPNNASKYSGKLKYADLQAQNGSSCVRVTPHAYFQYDYYACRFSYGYKIITFFVLTNPYTNEIVQAYGAFLPYHGSTVLVSQNNTTVWKKGNDSYANVVGQLYSQCGGWSTNIPSGNNRVYITGTIYSSQQVNLNQLFSGTSVYSSIVRKRNAQANDYYTAFINNYAFNNAPISGNCSDLGVYYSNIVPNMEYCKDGCNVALYLESSTSFVMQTSGFTYVPPNLRA